MDRIRLHRRLAAWLAIGALLLAGLLPAAVQAAVGGAGKAGWVEICSASGMVWVKADAGPDSPEHPAEAAQHCPWCNLHGGGGLPPANAGAAFLNAGAGAVPAFVAPAPRPAQPPATRSRAPPSAA